MILIDAHVHIHKCFNINSFLNAAYKNFKYQAAILDLEYFNGVLFLTEISNVNLFNEFFDAAKSKKNRLEDWKFILTEEENSLIAKRGDKAIYLIAGRQIITKENLEILAVGLNENIENGKKLEDVFYLINQKNAFVILPWGVGKWTGGRRNRLIDFLKRNNSKLFIGDNRNRPSFWPKDKLFNETNIPNLSGTDPLPLKSEERKAGTFGFAIRKKINSKQPFNYLKKEIYENDFQPIQFGKPEAIKNFLKNQILMQFKKR